MINKHKQGTPWSLEEIKEVLILNDSPYRPLFTEYKGHLIKEKWLCLKCNKSFRSHWKRIWKTVRGVHKGGCLRCAERTGYSIKKIKANLKKNKRPIICLSTEYVNNKAPMDWKCIDCGHEWKNYWKAIKGTRTKGCGPQGCIVCANNVKYTIERINQIVKEKGLPFKLISNMYIDNTSNNLEWQCLKCTEIWNCSWANINCSDRGCPRCATEGQTEHKIVTFLREVYGKNSFKKIRPEFLRNPKTGLKLEIDAYSEELNLAIEINGGQHYDYSDFFHRTIKRFKDLKARDRWKYKQIKNKEINLIVLDIRFKNLNKIKGLLKEKLTKLGYNIPEKFNELIIK